MSEIKLFIFTDKLKSRLLTESVVQESGHPFVYFESTSKMFRALECEEEFLPLVLLDSSAGNDTAAEIFNKFSCECFTFPVFIFGLNENEISLPANPDFFKGFLKLPFNSSELEQILQPAVNGEASGCRFDETGQETAHSGGDCITILAVDDSALIHRMLETIFSSDTYMLHHAYDGKEGFSVAVETSPDIVITDLEMPVMNGYDLCRMLKNDNRTSHIPVIIQSSLSRGLDIDKAFDAGADDYITKPVIAEELQCRVRNFLHPPQADRGTILIAESSTMIRNMICRGLEKQGFSTIKTDSGPEILRISEKNNIDLFILNQIMPEMEGREVVRELRKNANFKSTPVIMLSSRDTKLDLAKSRSAGISEFISKPFPIDKLVVSVERHIAEYRLQKEKDAMELYISDAALLHAREMAESGQKLTMQGSEEFRTILFSDIVGFTPMCENLEAAEVVSLLNEYLDLMVQIVRNNGGTIDKFIGDAVMAHYGGRDSGAYMAVKTGLEMLDALKGFNMEHDRQIHIRIGINSGDVIMGDIGSRYFRRDYTLIGDNVNTAQRLENACPQDRVLISASTWDLISNSFSAESRPPVSLKGKSKKIPCYLVESLLPEAEAASADVGKSPLSEAVLR